MTPIEATVTTEPLPDTLRVLLDAPIDRRAKTYLALHEYLGGVMAYVFTSEKNPQEFVGAFWGDYRPPDKLVKFLAINFDPGRERLVVKPMPDSKGEY